MGHSREVLGAVSGPLSGCLGAQPWAEGTEESAWGQQACSQAPGMFPSEVILL